MPTPLGERIRELRKKRGLTLEQLAKRVGSSKSYMWEIENKDFARPSAEKLSSIATALDTTVEYLLTGNVAEGEDPEDMAFYRKYKKMAPAAKKQLRRILKALDDDQ